jgi:ribosomal protein L29
LKIGEVRKIKPEDLGKKLSELRLELAKELGNVKMGRATKSPGKVGKLRKDIARILTFQKELKSASKTKGVR